MFRISRKLQTGNSFRCLQARLDSSQQCKPPTPPPKKPVTTGTLYTIGALALAGGATIAYAKHDPDFRQTLTEALPFTDGVIKFVFQEEESYQESLAGMFGGITKSLMGDGDDKRKKSAQIAGEKKEYKAPAPVIPIFEKDMKKDEESYTEIRIESDNENCDVEIGGDAKPKPGEKSLPETHPTSLAELEENICNSGSEAVNAYNAAICALKSYNEEINSLIDNSVENVKPALWESIREKTREKNDTLKRAEEKATEATKSIMKLRDILSKGSFDAPAASKEMTRLNIEKVQEDINKAKRDFDREKKITSATERYWNKVEEARKRFNKELEILFPTIDITNKNLHINANDLDLFLLYVYGHLNFYQKELTKLETQHQQRINLAVEAARKGAGEYLTTAQICDALEQEKRNLSLRFQEECLRLRKESESELREQLKRQSQAFRDHLDEALCLKAEEVERDLARKFDEQLDKERTRYKMQLAAMVGRLKGLDYALKAKDDADKIAKQSQVLWSACQSLHRAIRSGCPGIGWKDQLRPLSPEIDSIKKAAAKNDELVHIVINGIPKLAKERGVYPEDALRERFLKVEQVARTLALVPENGATLPVYLLSYVQSFLLVKAASPIPKCELNNEQVDFSKLNTNEILQRARYWLDRGDFAQTLKYMNLLKGAPRSIAKEWMEETRILLETQQAANTLMAHATSGGLIYL